MRSLAGRVRRVVGWTVGILFMAAILAAVIFGFLPIMDIGPDTGIWLGLVFAGYIILGAAFVYTWVQYLRTARTTESEKGKA